MKNSPSVPSRGRYRFRLHETRISIVLPTTTSFRFLPSYSAFLTGDGARCNNEVNAFLAANGFSKPRGGLGACPGYIFNFTSRLFFALLFFLSYRDASFLPLFFLSRATSFERVYSTLPNGCTVRNFAETRQPNTRCTRV